MEESSQKTYAWPMDMDNGAGIAWWSVCVGGGAGRAWMEEVEGEKLGQL